MTIFCGGDSRGGPVAMIADTSEIFVQDTPVEVWTGYVLAVMEMPVVEWKRIMTTF